MKRADIYLRVAASVGLLAALAFFLAPPAQAEDARTGADPAINKPYEDAPDFDTWVRRFESEGREIYDRRYQIVTALDLSPGMRVADIGAGTGLFARLFAPQVGPQGRVYAVDISRVFIDNIARLAKQQRLENITTILSTQTDTKLPERSIDLAFVCDTYHHFEQPEAMLASIKRALRPGGSLVVLDFHRDREVNPEWIMGHVRADKRAVIREIERAGFELLDDNDLLKTNYFLRFKRP